MEFIRKWRMTELGSLKIFLLELWLIIENIVKCRKVVDHMVLFRMKDDLKEEQEKEMLESLFTIQYQVKGIISLSVGKFRVTTSLKCYLLYVIDLRATPFVTLNNILS